ncbi:hypothetical protein JHK87_021582 [Glycine soja]|nr:hypothetical protein JHK87_021582 [Glycine soja]
MTKGCLRSRLVISTMKSPLPPIASDDDVEDKKMKKKANTVENDDDVEHMEGLVHFNDNLLFKVLKHMDVWTLAMSRSRCSMVSLDRSKDLVTMNGTIDVKKMVSYLNPK